MVIILLAMIFKWEGKRRTGLANLGLEELKKVTDSIIVVKNDKLKEISDPNTGMKDAFKIVDNILYQAVNGMSEVILKPGANDINADFADIKTIMQHRGMALMGIGRAKGEDAAMLALENAIKSPLLDEVSLNGAQGIMVHWTVNPNIALFSITSIMEEISETIHGDADIIFGTTTDDTLEEDEVKITIVATGFDINNEVQASDITNNTSANIKPPLTPNDPEYYDVPPLMRGYSIKFQL